jgi:hypothetical protein
VFKIVQEGSEYFLLVLLELFRAGAFEGISSDLFEVRVGFLDHLFELFDLLKEFRVLLFNDFFNDFDLRFFFLRSVTGAAKQVASKKFRNS